MKVLHMGHGLVVTTDAENHVTQLQHPIVATHGIQVMITTGAGYRQIAKIDEQGDFLFSEGNMNITQHAKYKQPGTEVHASRLSVFTFEPEKGFRQCGAGTVNMERLLHHACEGTPFEFAADLFIPTENESTTTVKISMMSTACTQERVALRSWLDTHADVVQVLKYNVVSSDEVYKQLATHRKDREQKVSDSLNGIYGNVNQEVKLGNNLFLLQDTGMDVADPTQANAFLRKANLRAPETEGQPMWLKNAVCIARSQFLAVAEQCVSEKHRESGVDQPITMAVLKAFVEYNTRSLATPKEMILRKQLFKRLIRTFKNVTTCVDTGLRSYAFDEAFKIQDDCVVASEQDSEKMDMWCGSLYLHWDATQKEYSANMGLMQELQNERAKIIHQLQNKLTNVGLSAANPTESLLKINQQINMLNGEQECLRRHEFYQPRDCEDGAMYNVILFEVAKMFPRETFKIVKPWCGSTFVPMCNAYGLEASAAQAMDKTVEIQRVVELSLQLVSDALRWQAEVVDGTKTTYEVCLGLASAPSMDTKTDGLVGAPTNVSRETCSSYGDYVGRLFQGHKLGGHCFAVEAQTSNTRQLAHGGKIEEVKINAMNILESTTVNVSVDQEEGHTKKALGSKTISMSINGVLQTMQDVPHEQVRAVIGRQMLKDMNETLGLELTGGFASDIELGTEFYNVFAHIGFGRCVTGEKLVANKICTLNARATLEAIHTSCMATSFCNSTIAWDACPKSKVTTAVVVSMPLHAEEEHRLDQMVHELTTVHAMTKDQLSFIMTKMGHVVTAGFENGVFVGTDYTGQRLDSDKRVALTFTLQTTKLAATLPEYSDPNTSVGTVILRKLGVVFPGIEFRIKQVETSSYLLQAFVQAG
jgi:hypothetical protein